MSWPMVKLGDVAPATPVKDINLDQDELVWQLNLDQVESNTGQVIDKVKKPALKAGSSTYFFNNEHVLYSKLRPYLNKVVIPDELGIATTELVPMKPDQKRLNKKYLAYYLRSKPFVEWISTQVSGAKMPRVVMSVFWQHEMPLPPLDEQERIVSILDKSDGIRQKREQAIKLADDFLRTTFLEMFGDPVENPKGWKVKPLISLIVGKLQNGAYFPKDKYSKDGVEMVHMADAFYDVIQRGSLKRVQASDADIVKYSLSHEDLMISRRSLNYEGAAKPSLIPHSDEPLIFESSMIRITPDKKQIDKLFLFYYLTDPLVKEHFIRKFVTGATIKGINQKNLEQVRIIVPPLELQKEFSYIVHTLEKNKKKLNESEILSIEQFTTISQRAFLGQL